MGKVWIIGIAGGSASGKSTVVRRLRDYFGDDIGFVSHDSYYKAHDDLTYEERCRLNYDHPDALETDRMVEDLRRLKEGHEIECPVYDFTVHNRSAETVKVQPKRVVIVEGIMILENRELRNLLDLKVYVDADADERITRRLIRDMKERGRSAESVVNQYIATVKPMHEKYVEPTKKYADIISPRGGHNKLAISILTEYLKTVMASED